MQSAKLPKVYMDYNVEELLKVMKEVQEENGTQASQAKIKAMSELAREFQLTPIHQVLNGKVLERIQEILPTDLSQKDQLRKIQEKVRKFAKKKNLGQIKIDIIPRGKVAYEKPIRSRKTERGRG